MYYSLPLEVDYDSLNEIDLGPRPGQQDVGAAAGQLTKCGKCVKEQCVSPENCLAGKSTGLG